MIEIASYKIEDLENIVELWHYTWHQTFPHLHHPQTYVEWKVRFRDEIAVFNTIWTAKIGHEIVGFIAVNQAKRTIEQLFILPKYQNRGVGSLLLQTAKSVCQTGLKLYTLQHNDKARKFYEKHGFKIGETTINPVNGQPSISYYWKP